MSTDQQTNTHSPGPWAYVYGGNPEGEWLVGGIGCLPIVAAVFADPDGGLVDGATIEANARLISCAPELLETLKKFVAHVREITHDFDDEDDEAPELVAADALIAKAEGREP